MIPIPFIDISFSILAQPTFWYTAQNGNYQNDLVSTFNAPTTENVWPQFVGVTEQGRLVGAISHESIIYPTPKAFMINIPSGSVFGSYTAELSKNNIRYRSGFTIFNLRRNGGFNQSGVARSGSSIWEVANISQTDNNLKQDGDIFRIIHNDTNIASAKFIVVYQKEIPGGFTLNQQGYTIIQQPNDNFFSFPDGPDSLILDVFAVRPYKVGTDSVPRAYLTSNGRGTPGGLYHVAGSSGPSGYTAITPTIETKSVTSRPINLFAPGTLGQTQNTFQRRQIEHIVFDRALTQEEINTVEGYLRTKYNLTY